MAGWRKILGTLGTTLGVVFLVVVLVASGGWRALSAATGIGDPNASVEGIESEAKGGPMPARPPWRTPQPGTTPAAPDAPRKTARPSWKTALDGLDQVPSAPARLAGYDRESAFGGWSASKGLGGKATTRDDILKRDLTDVRMDGSHRVASGSLRDPYTGRTISFKRGVTTSKDVQIDHVVALEDAWASGARDWPQSRRVAYANSPDVLLATDGPANEAKGAGLDFNGRASFRTQGTKAPDVWLPDNRDYRCDYMAKRALIKETWRLSMTAREKQQTVGFLASCLAS